MSESQREHPRVNAPRILVRISTEERMRAAYLRDLSEGGVFIRMERPFEPGTRLTVELLPPGHTEPISLTGLVVHVRSLADSSEEKPAGMGVKFEDLAGDSSRQLQELIAGYSAQQPREADELVREQAMQLRALSEQLGVLRREVEAKEKERLEERTRRVESSTRLAELTRELGETRLKVPTGAPPGDAQRQLAGELASTLLELDGVRSRLIATEATAASLREELQVLEQDDTTSRQFAEKLARQLNAVRAETAAGKAKLAALTADLDSERSGARTRIAALEEQLAAESTRLATERARAAGLEQQLESQQQERSRAEGRATALEPFKLELAQTQEHLQRLEERLQSTQAALGTEQQARAQAAAELSETREKLERARRNEREIRELLALASRSGPDETVVVSPAPPAGPQQPPFGASPAPGAPMAADVDVDLDV